MKEIFQINDKLEWYLNSHRKNQAISPSEIIETNIAIVLRNMQKEQIYTSRIQTTLTDMNLLKLSLHLREFRRKN